MPNKNSIVARVTNPVTIEQAREQGFTTFTFHPTARDAEDAAINVAAMTERKTVFFTEVFEIEGTKLVLHVVGQTRRPKPHVSRFDGPVKPYREATPFGGTYRTTSPRFEKPHHGGMCPDCGWFMCQCPALTAVQLLERLADKCTNEGTRILVHATWHLENPVPRHSAKLDAFAVFMGEWAAKIRNAVR